MNRKNPFASRMDENEPEIVKALEAAGVIVHRARAVGKGFPDLVCGYGGLTVLIEIKRNYDYDRGTRGIEHVVGKLTPDQEKWHAEWKGQKVVIVRTIQAALDCFGL